MSKRAGPCCSWLEAEVRHHHCERDPSASTSEPIRRDCQFHYLWQVGIKVRDRKTVVGLITSVFDPAQDEKWPDVGIPTRMKCVFSLNHSAVAAS